MEMTQKKPVLVLIVITILSFVRCNNHQMKRTNNERTQTVVVNQRYNQWQKKIHPKTNEPQPTPLSEETVRQYVQKNCTSCLIREEAKFARIEKIKEDLLQKLGFKNAPNTSGELPLITPHLQNIFERWGVRSDGVQAEGNEYGNTVDGQESFAARTERVYSFATESPFMDVPESSYFRFSESTSNNKVENATLHFYLNNPKNGARVVETNLKVDLYKIEDPTGTTHDFPHKSYTYKTHLYRPGNWIQIDVTKLVQQWFENPDSNFGIKLEVLHKGENLVAYPQSKDANGGSHTMYLEIVTSLSRPRVKRDIPKLECEEKDNDTRCCRYPLIIDFESFGWDWVIAPKKYRANYCSGECPFKHLQRYLHTHLVQQVNPRGNAGPCCYPTQMSPILMVYFNENKEVLVSKVPGMIVTRCGCA